MALTADFNNLIIYSDASITDMVAFHDALRDIEASDDGLLYPTIHTYKEVQLGGGAIFPAVAFVNGWTLQFPVGNWAVSGGNLNATINPVAGCYVKQTQSAAYAVSSAMGGTTGPTAEEVAAATVSMLATRIIENGMTSDDLTRLMASVLLGKVTGAGTGTEHFRDLADTKDRVVATVDNSGNRTAITLDAT